MIAWGRLLEIDYLKLIAGDWLIEIDCLKWIAGNWLLDFLGQAEQFDLKIWRKNQKEEEKSSRNICKTWKNVKTSKTKYFSFLFTNKFLKLAQRSAKLCALSRMCNHTFKKLLFWLELDNINMTLSILEGIWFTHSASKIKIYKVCTVYCIGCVVWIIQGCGILSKVFSPSNLALWQCAALIFCWLLQICQN